MGFVLPVRLKLNLDRDISFSDLPHVEPDCRNHIFTEMPRLKGKTSLSFIKRKKKPVISNAHFTTSALYNQV